MSLWEKAAKFYIRHLEFQQLAEEAAGGETIPQRRVLWLMDWTRSQVKPIPPGMPFVDDHILHIVLRHYGNDGQLSEVFTALATYTGNEGRWVGSLQASGSQRASGSLLCRIEWNMVGLGCLERRLVWNASRTDRRDRGLQVSGAAAAARAGPGTIGRGSLYQLFQGY